MRGLLITSAAFLLVCFSIYFFKKQDSPENQEDEQTAQVVAESLPAKSLKPKTTSSEFALPTRRTVPSPALEEGGATKPNPKAVQAASVTATSSEKTDSNTEKVTSLLKGLKDEKILQAFKLPKDISLSPEQAGKMEQLKDKYTPKLTDVLTKIDGILSDEQKEARNEALLQSALQGDSPDVRNQILRKTVNLSEDQQKARMDLNRAYSQIRTEIHQDVEQFLSPDQKQQLPPNWNRPRPPRP